MGLFESIIMGIIQGFTEFLPVSSSGHLAIFKNVFGYNAEIGLTFDILLHIGTLFAVFIVFWKDIKELIIVAFKMIGDIFHNLFTALSGKKDFRKILSDGYRRFVVLIIVSTIPTGIMGLLGKDLVETAGENMLIIGICLLVTAILLFISDNIKIGTKDAKTASYLNAGIIGVAQGFATLPGLSRSGTTITACLINGFDKEFAVKYSFIMSIPAILGAALLDVKDLLETPPQTNELVNYISGMIAAAVVGFLCIKFVTVLVKNRKFKYFGYYCVLAGALSILWYFGVFN